jgi:RNA polymerase sigma-70 factor (family 1)
MEVEFNIEREAEQQLVDQVQGQDKKAFESLYKKFYKRLYVLAYQYVEEHEGAEEIVHDVFINIWKRQDKIVIQQSLKSYLFRSVINTSLNYKKSRKQAEEKLDKYSEGQTEVWNGPEKVEETETLLSKLEAALELLPPQCKKVMMLSRFEKLKQKDIAEQMGISIKTVKNHLTYGFNKMRTILDNKITTWLLLAAVIVSYF